MANNLKPEQDLLVRQFFVDVVQDDSVFPDAKSNQRALTTICLGLLNYVVVDGKFVSPENLKSTTYGQKVEYEDEWIKDTKAVQERMHADTSDDPAETDSGEQTESSEVRETVLREDV